LKNLIYTISLLKFYTVVLKIILMYYLIVVLYRCFENHFNVLFNSSLTGCNMLHQLGEWENERKEDNT